jgi:transposase
MEEGWMLTLGVDAHKQIHVAVALDEAGRECGQWRGPNSPTGWQELQEWALALGASRHWGIEGAWNYGRGLAQYLVAAGETVYEVNARWTAWGRSRARRPGKTDQLDARSVATCVRQEAPGLPEVRAEDTTTVLDLLTSERETVLGEATRLRNQLHALLGQLDPEYEDHLPRLETREEWAVLEKYQAASSNEVPQARAASVRRLAQRLTLALTQAEDLASQIKSRTTAEGFAPLTEICGVGLLLAGTLAGILGPGCRFRTDAELAAYAGVAPLETSSASKVRHRLSRSGNRRLNSLVHLVAVTQLRCYAPAKTYIKRRLGEGKTKREALRALKRYLVRAIWQAWKRCLAPEPPPPQLSPLPLT